MRPGVGAAGGRGDQQDAEGVSPHEPATRWRADRRGRSEVPRMPHGGEALGPECLLQLRPIREIPDHATFMEKENTLGWLDKLGGFLS